MSKLNFDNLIADLRKEAAALAPRGEAARLRADLLGGSSNDFDRSLAGVEITSEEEDLIDRFIDVANRAGELAERLEERAAHLEAAAQALEAAQALRGRAVPA